MNQRDRQFFEQHEKRILTPFAVFSAEGRGRIYDEPEHVLRTCFQRDRDRVIHSAAFRRLEAKTQVFVSPDNDYCRTRLTHTIEVAQVARTMARILGVNEDLAEVTALAHDLGHPPFGHSGEKVLDELMADYGGFEHNRNSLRVVEFLEHPYPGFYGLNLTFETRECLAKHETHYDHPEWDETYGTGYGPLEGQLVDLADSIAYNSHDIDDALAGGLIQEEELNEIALYNEVQSQTNERYPQAHRHARQLRAAKLLIDHLARDVMHEALARLEAIQPCHVDDIRHAPQKIIALSNKRQRQLDELQQFLYEKVYRHPEVLTAQKKAGHELRCLFNHYLKSPDTLPPRYQRRINDMPLHQIACDYLAGMTDRFCHEMYGKFF